MPVQYSPVEVCMGKIVQSVEKPLTSLKVIAGFLDVSVLTLYRYAKRGLPLHRGNGAGSTVFAYPSELKEWMKKR